MKKELTINSHSILIIKNTENNIYTTQESDVLLSLDGIISKVSL